MTRTARSPIVTAAACLGAAVFTSLSFGQGPDTAGVEFFEKKIRPVLVKECYACHSAAAATNKKLKGGLFLDTREAMLKGGDAGRALVPGKPNESPLVTAIRYTTDLTMPPKGKLPDAIIADFEKWVEMGAPAPKTGGVPASRSTTAGIDIESGRKFWSYQLPRRSAAPAVRDSAWPVNDIDRFILARLEKETLRPAPEADRATLIRRVYYDLHGLPPTPAEVDAFVADSDTRAYEKLVDRLLASPHYGERWGRHWLDVARYAESITLRGTIFKEAWRYRDYVIESFNADVPYDRLIREQIAGDLLPAADVADRRRKLVATAYLVLGNNNLEEQDKAQLRMDVVDEQLDVIGKGLLGQTLTCARCHDHKFDPIPTRDYYALAGILRNAKALEDANVSTWVERPLPGEAVEEAEVVKHEAAVKALQSRIVAARKAAGSGAVVRGAMPIKDIQGVVIDDVQAKKVGTWQPSRSTGTFIGDGYLHDMNDGKGSKTLTFEPESLPAGRYEVRLAYSHGTSRSVSVPVTVASAEGETTITVDMKTEPPIDGRYVSLGQFAFEKNGQAYVLVSTEGTSGHVTADAVVFVSVDAPKPTTTAEGSTAPKAKAKAAAKASSDQVKRLEAQLKKLQETGPKLTKVVSVVEEKKIEDTHVHVRGSVHSLGEAAPRGFLRVATYGTAPAISATESGRRQLADWIASPENPLTARVMANRTWHWLFGAGLVRTTDNFGVTGELPSHPELLDHLATQFVDEGWSIKKLVRAIVLSRTYRQSSTSSTSRTDPENQLFGRQHRRRMDAESIRDALLAVSGQLKRAVGGPNFPATLAVDYNFKPADERRSIYGPMFRNAIPDLLAAFNAADPSMVTGQRDAGTVAPQALVMLNHPFVIEQARHTAERLLVECKTDEERVVWAYRAILGRPPTAAERSLALKYAASAAAAKDAWALVAQALFASVEFRYIH